MVNLRGCESCFKANGGKKESFPRGMANMWVTVHSFNRQISPGLLWIRLGVGAHRGRREGLRREKSTRQISAFQGFAILRRKLTNKHLNSVTNPSAPSWLAKQHDISYHQWCPFRGKRIKHFCWSVSPDCVEKCLGESSLQRGRSSLPMGHSVVSSGAWP